jgi:hypothetical protein
LISLEWRGDVDVDMGMLRCGHVDGPLRSLRVASTSVQWHARIVLCSLAMSSSLPSPSGLVLCIQDASRISSRYVYTSDLHKIYHHAQSFFSGPAVNVRSLARDESLTSPTCPESSLVRVSICLCSVKGDEGSSAFFES